MGKRKVIVVDDEITVKAFDKLPKAVGGRTKKVDYDKLIERLNGRVLSIGAVGKEMIACSGKTKSKVYYSEVLGALKRLQEAGRIAFTRRQGPVIMYHFTIPEPEVKAPAEQA